LDRSQLQALVEYQKSAAPGMLAEGQAEMLIGTWKFFACGHQESMFFHWQTD